MADIDDLELDRLRKGQALLDQLLKAPKTKRATEKLAPASLETATRILPSLCIATLSICSSSTTLRAWIAS